MYMMLYDVHACDVNDVYLYIYIYDVNDVNICIYIYMCVCMMHLLIF